MEVKGHKGMGIIGVLTLILIVLKIVRVIDWGWIIIFLPLMASLLIKLFIWLISVAVLIYEWRARK